MPERKGFYWIWYSVGGKSHRPEKPAWIIAEWDGEDWTTENGAIFSYPVPVGPFIGDRSGKPSGPPEELNAMNEMQAYALCGLIVAELEDDRRGDVLGKAGLAGAAGESALSAGAGNGGRGAVRAS